MELAMAFKEGVIPEAVYYYLGVQSDDEEDEEEPFANYKLVVMARTDIDISPGNLCKYVA